MKHRRLYLAALTAATLVLGAFGFAAAGAGTDPRTCDPFADVCTPDSTTATVPVNPPCPGCTTVTTPPPPPPPPPTTTAKATTTTATTTTTTTTTVGGSYIGPDADRDGVPDTRDNCPTVPNSNPSSYQYDGNGNGVGALCDQSEAVIDGFTSVGYGEAVVQDNYQSYSTGAQTKRIHDDYSARSRGIFGLLSYHEFTVRHFMSFSCGARSGANVGKVFNIGGYDNAPLEIHDPWHWDGAYQRGIVLYNHGDYAYVKVWSHWTSEVGGVPLFNNIHPYSVFEIFANCTHRLDYQGVDG